MAPKKWIYDEVGKSQEYMSNLVWEFISWSRRADAGRTMLIQFTSILRLRSDLQTM